MPLDESKGCPKCGGMLFAVVPGVTTSDEIVQFQEEVTRRRGIHFVDRGWIHPGTFCYSCDWCILVEHLPPGYQPAPDDQRDAILVLESGGTDRLAVAAIIKNRLEIASREALDLVAAGKVTLMRRIAPQMWELERLRSEIVSAGGIAHIERVEQ